MAGGFRRWRRLFAFAELGVDSAGRPGSVAAARAPGRRRCRRSVPPAFALESLQRRDGSTRGIAGARPVEVGAQPGPGASTYSMQLVSVTRAAAEVAVLVESVEWRGRCCRSVGQAVPAIGLLDADEELGQFGRRLHADFARSRAFFTTGSASAKIGPEASPASPRLFSETVSASENGVRVPGRVGQRRRRVAEVFEHRRARVGEVFRLAIVWRNSAQEGGELLQRLFQFGALFGAGLGGGAGVGEEAGDVRALARERAEDLPRSREASWASCSRWA